MRKTKHRLIALALFSFLAVGISFSPVAAQSAEDRAKTYCDEKYAGEDNLNQNVYNTCVTNAQTKYATAISECNASGDDSNQRTFEACVSRKFSAATTSQGSGDPFGSGGGTGSGGTTNPGSIGIPNDGEYDCKGVKISIDVECTDATNPILAYLGGITNFLSVGVGLILLLSFIILGMQYTMSAGDPQRVKLAKDRAVNISLAGITYFLLYAILKWLIPGGF